MEIHVELRIGGDGFPAAEQLRIRHELEDCIHDNGIGQVVDAGAGRGVMDIFVEASSDRALDAIERLIAERGLSQVASVRRIR